MNDSATSPSPATPPDAAAPAAATADTAAAPLFTTANARFVRLWEGVWVLADKGWVDFTRSHPPKNAYVAHSDE